MSKGSGGNRKSSSSNPAATSASLGGNFKSLYAGGGTIGENQEFWKKEFAGDAKFQKQLKSALNEKGYDLHWWRGLYSEVISPIGQSGKSASINLSVVQNRITIVGNNGSVVIPISPTAKISQVKKKIIDAIKSDVLRNRR